LQGFLHALLVQLLEKPGRGVVHSAYHFGLGYLGEACENRQGLFEEFVLGWTCKTKPNALAAQSKKIHLWTCMNY
jgi:hypothetical protein